MAAISVNEEAKRAANLRVLQRTVNKSIIDIVGSATHVVLYDFNCSAQAWEKRNCEGSLFVVKRSDAPRFNIVVMNRTSKENLVVAITSTFQMQVREPYLIFRSEKANNDTNEQQIRGIWFHNSEEREAIRNILSRIVTTLDNTSTDQEQSVTKVDQVKNMSHSEATASLLSALKINKKDPNQTNDVNEQVVPKQKVSSNDVNENEQVVPELKVPSNVDQEKQLLPSTELDKKSLQLTLMSLLQDDRFLDLIHAQYIKVVKARKGNSS
jgi:mRNA-decapping enzyme 1B